MEGFLEIFSSILRCVLQFLEPFIGLKLAYNSGLLKTSFSFVMLGLKPEITAAPDAPNHAPKGFDMELTF